MSRLTERLLELFGFSGRSLSDILSNPSEGAPGGQPGRRSSAITVRRQPAIVVGRSRNRTTVVAPGGPQATVGPEVAPWQDLGWQRRSGPDRETYTGRYRARLARTGRVRTFQGLVYRQGNHITCLIADPPREIRRHRKWICFRRVNKSWYRLEWRWRPKSVSDAILYMERLLDEAFNNDGEPRR